MIIANKKLKIVLKRDRNLECRQNCQKLADLAGCTLTQVPVTIISSGRSAVSGNHLIFIWLNASKIKIVLALRLSADQGQVNHVHGKNNTSNSSPMPNRVSRKGIDQLPSADGCQQHGCHYSLFEV